jgi:hypothetical protein
MGVWLVCNLLGIALIAGILDWNRTLDMPSLQRRSRATCVDAARIAQNASPPPRRERRSSAPPDSGQAGRGRRASGTYPISRLRLHRGPARRHGEPARAAR